MNLITCRCCGAVSSPEEDTSPDWLIVDQDGVAQIAVVSTDLCFPCREGGPITHAIAHAEDAE